MEVAVAGPIVIVENIARPVDNGTLVRCAVAMGAQEISTIGFNSYGKNGARGSQRYIKRSHFYDWKEFFQYLQDQYSVLPPKSRIQEGKAFAVALSPATVCGILLNHDLIEEAHHTKAEERNEIPVIPVIPLNETNFSQSQFQCFIVIDYRHATSKSGMTPKEIIAYYEPYCDYFSYVNLPNQANDRFLHDDAKVTLFLQKYAIERRLPPILFTEEEKHTINKQQIIDRLKNSYQRKESNTQSKNKSIQEEEEDQDEGDREELCDDFQGMFSQPNAFEDEEQEEIDR